MISIKHCIRDYARVNGSLRWLHNLTRSTKLTFHICTSGRDSKMSSSHQGKLWWWRRFFLLIVQCPNLLTKWWQSNVIIKFIESRFWCWSGKSKLWKVVLVIFIAIYFSKTMLVTNWDSIWVHSWACRRMIFLHIVLATLWPILLYITRFPTFPMKQR